MFDTDAFISTAPISALDDLRTFIDEQADGLFDAAALLGGLPGARTAHSVIDGLNNAGTPSRRTVRALDDLLDLLMLENVHDVERIEAAQFAALDPASPVVEEICLLADGLHNAISTYRRSLDTMHAEKVAA